MKTATIHSDLMVGYVVKFYENSRVTSVAEFNKWDLAFAFAWNWKYGPIA